jgi:sortase B
MLKTIKKKVCIILLAAICSMTQSQLVTAQDLLSVSAVETTAQTSLEETDVLTLAGITVPQKDLDWDALHQQNQDIYAWIYIPNTNIDYPILQHPTDANYYINYNIDGTKGYPGCICTQYYNSKDFTDSNTIVYGHNMKNGSMFRTLHNFEKKSFFDENPYVYIYTPETTYVYEIFATSTVSKKHLLTTYNFSEEKGFNTFISYLTSSKSSTSHIRKGSEAVFGDKLLTMSTCNGKSNQRWIVVGKRLN